MFSSGHGTDCRIAAHLRRSRWSEYLKELIRKCSIVFCCWQGRPRHSSWLPILGPEKKMELSLCSLYSGMRLAKLVSNSVFSGISERLPPLQGRTTSTASQLIFHVYIAYETFIKTRVTNHGPLRTQVPRANSQFHGINTGALDLIFTSRKCDF